MGSFIRNLKNKRFAQGEKLDAESLIVAQKILVNMKLDFLPHSYTEFLKIYNGIKAEGAYIFGATVDDDLDIIDKNEQMQRPRDCIILGYNDFDLLVYHFKKHKYMVLDREDYTIIDEYDEKNLDDALAQIFNV